MWDLTHNAHTHTHTHTHNAHNIPETKRLFYPAPPLDKKASINEYFPVSHKTAIYIHSKLLRSVDKKAAKKG